MCVPLYFQASTNAMLDAPSFLTVLYRRKAVPRRPSLDTRTNFPRCAAATAVRPTPYRTTALANLLRVKLDQRDECGQKVEYAARPRFWTVGSRDFAGNCRWTLTHRRHSVGGDLCDRIDLRGMAIPLVDLATITESKPYCCTLRNMARSNVHALHDENVLKA